MLWDLTPYFTVGHTVITVSTVYERPVSQSTVMYAWYGAMDEKVDDGNEWSKLKVYDSAAFAVNAQVMKNGLIFRDFRAT